MNTRLNDNNIWLVNVLMTQKHVCFWRRSELLLCLRLHSLITIEKSQQVTVAVSYACVMYRLQLDFAFHPSVTCNLICESSCIHSYNNNNALSRLKRTLSCNIKSRTRNNITVEYGRQVFLFIFTLIPFRYDQLLVFILLSLPIHNHVFIYSTCPHNSFL